MPNSCDLPLAHIFCVPMCPRAVQELRTVVNSIEFLLFKAELHQPLLNKHL